MSTQVPLAMAVDVVCDREFAQMPTRQLMTLKIAVMMRMGVSDPVVILGVIEGSEHHNYQDMIAVAGIMLGEPEQARIFDYVEACVRRLLDAAEKAA